MIDSINPPAIFISGSLGLDFLNSLARPVDEEVDWLSNGSELLSWMEQAGLVSADDLNLIRTNMTAKDLDRTSAKARALREWLRHLVKRYKGKNFRPQDLSELELLNKILEPDEMYWSVVPAPPGASEKNGNENPPAIFQLRTHRRWKKPDALLFPIAEEIAKFICAVDFRQVKGCLGHNCVLFFWDQTRRRNRRWCSMAVCGNRAKQEAHLERIRQGNHSNKAESNTKRNG